MAGKLTSYIAGTSFNERFNERRRDWKQMADAAWQDFERSELAGAFRFGYGRVRGDAYLETKDYKQPKFSKDEFAAFVQRLNLSESMNLQDGTKNSAVANLIVAGEASARFYTGNFGGQTSEAFFKDAGFDMVQVHRNAGSQNVYDGMFLAKKMPNGEVIVMGVHTGLDGDRSWWGDRGIVGGPSTPHPRGGFVHAALHADAKDAAQLFSDFVRQVQEQYPGATIRTQHLGHSAGGGLTPEIDRISRLQLAGSGVIPLPYAVVNQGPLGDEKYVASLTRDGVTGMNIHVKDDWSNRLVEKGWNQLAGLASWSGLTVREFDYPGRVTLLERGSARDWEEDHSIAGTYMKEMIRLAKLPNSGVSDLFQPVLPDKKPPIEPDPKERRQDTTPIASLGVGPIEGVVADKATIPNGKLATEVDGVQNVPHDALQGRQGGVAGV